MESIQRLIDKMTCKLQVVSTERHRGCIIPHYTCMIHRICREHLKKIVIVL